MVGLAAYAAVEMRGCGIITPDQESGTRVGLHKVTVNSSRVAQSMLVLGTLRRK